MNGLQGHANVGDHMQLREKVLLVADLVTADATRQTSPKKTLSLDADGTVSHSVPSDEEGRMYLLIRKAFGAAFEELIQQASFTTVMFGQVWKCCFFSSCNSHVIRWQSLGKGPDQCHHP